MNDAILAGLAALYAWVFASQLTTPIVAPVQRWLRRGWRRSLVSCPWCSAWWLSIAFVALLQWGRYGWVETPVTILAAAGLAGIVGSMTPGILDEEDDE